MRGRVSSCLLLAESEFGWTNILLQRRLLPSIYRLISALNFPIRGPLRMRYMFEIFACVPAAIPAPASIWRRLASPALIGLMLGISANQAFCENLVVAVARQPLSLPFYVAEAEGHFAAEGLQLRIEDCNFGRACLEKLLSKQVVIFDYGDRDRQEKNFPK